MRIKQSLYSGALTFFSLVFLLVCLANTQQNLVWKPFVSVEDLRKKVIALDKDGREVKSDEKLLQLNEFLQQESETLNRAWENEYSKRVSALQKVNENYEDYKRVQASVQFFENSLKQINDSIESNREIYKNRLKAIPTAFLLLTKTSITSAERPAEKANKLLEMSKVYLVNTRSDAMVYSETEVKNMKVVSDLIELLQAGSVESFESDPIWFITPDNQFCLLQKYRLFPNFPEKESMTGNEFSETKYKGVSFFEISSDEASELPSYWKKAQDTRKQIMAKVYEVNAFNQTQKKKLLEVDQGYEKAVLSDLLKKKKNLVSRLAAEKKELETFTKKGSLDFEKNRKDAEEDLNIHVKFREILVFTIRTDLQQSGGSLNEEFQKIISLAYDDLIKRAQGMRSYKFYRVENHVLTSENAETFYDMVLPVSYSLPIRRKTYYAEEGGLNRLGVLLALKVKLESTGKLVSISTSATTGDGTSDSVSLTDEMVVIPAGEFMMGSNGGNDDEKPIHKVFLDAYSIDKYEVTNAEYYACMKSGACLPPHGVPGNVDPNHIFYQDSYAKNPVADVDWKQADAFCKWRGKRLPTEAEWEKSSRGESGNIWPWGNTSDCKKSCNSVLPCKQNSTCEVGYYSRDVSPYGVYDMAGNVWEWVSDWYDASYYESAPYKNPKGPDGSQYKVLRGGSWDDSDPYSSRGANRFYSDPTFRYYGNGFRCAR